MNMVLEGKKKPRGLLPPARKQPLRMVSQVLKVTRRPIEPKSCGLRNANQRLSWWWWWWWGQFEEGPSVSCYLMNTWLGVAFAGYPHNFMAAVDETAQSELCSVTFPSINFGKFTTVLLGIACSLFQQDCM